MGDALRDLLAPYLDSSSCEEPSRSSTLISGYLNRLTSLSLSSLSTTEPESLNQASQSNVLSLRALASRSAKSSVISAGHLSTLSEAIPAASYSVSDLRNSIPLLDQQTVQFSTTYGKSRDDNEILDRRKNAMLLSRQADKVSDVLELPSLLSTAIASASSGTTGGANYSQALDLYAHIKRLQILYPDSTLVKSVVGEADAAMREMTTNLIMSLRASNIRLAAAIRTIGFLRRVAPELAGTPTPQATSTSKTTYAAPTTTETTDEGLYGALFLTARLASLLSMLEALSPLRELADQETERSQGYGQQTERYLKRYVEIFREQSFNTISMYRNIFPPPPSSSSPEIADDPLQLPSALATFPLHLISLLTDTLQQYLPNIRDPQARESLLMQVLYAANSLGRLGADFSMMLALLGVDDVAATQKNGDGETEEEGKAEPPEWIRVIEKHRVQAARLEALSSGQEQMTARRGSGLSEVAAR